MEAWRTSYRDSRRGFASILALLVLTVCVTLGLVVASVSDLEVQKANNFKSQMDARMAAESGMEICTYFLRNAQLPVSQQALMDNLATYLADELDSA